MTYVELITTQSYGLNPELSNDPPAKILPLGPSGELFLPKTRPNPSGGVAISFTSILDTSDFDTNSAGLLSSPVVTPCLYDFNLDTKTYELYSMYLTGKFFAFRDTIPAFILWTVPTHALANHEYKIGFSIDQYQAELHHNDGSRTPYNLRMNTIVRALTQI